MGFENVTVTKGEVLILEKVTAMVPRGSWTAIVGPNGAGKTTLLLALLGEISYAGNITTACRLSAGCARIGYVPQRLAFDRGIPLTVSEFLVTGMQRKPLWLGISPKLRERALNLLAAVKVEHLAGRKLRRPLGRRAAAGALGPGTPTGTGSSTPGRARLRYRLSRGASFLRAAGKPQARVGLHANHGQP